MHDKQTDIRLFDEGKDMVTKVMEACEELQGKGFYICGFRLGRSAFIALAKNHPMDEETRDRFLGIIDSNEDVEDKQLGTWLGCPYALSSKLKPNEIQIVFATWRYYTTFEIDEQWLT